MSSTVIPQITVIPVICICSHIVEKAEAPIYFFTFYKTLECHPHCFVQTNVSRKYRYYVSLKILQHKYSLSQLWAAIELTSALKITTALAARPWTCLKMIKRNRYPLLAVKAQLILDRYMVCNIHNNSTAAYHACTLGGGRYFGEHEHKRIAFKSLTHHRETQHTLCLCQITCGEYSWSFFWKAASYHSTRWRLQIFQSQITVKSPAEIKKKKKMTFLICFTLRNQIAIVYLIQIHTKCVREMQRQNQLEESTTFPQNKVALYNGKDLKWEGFRLGDSPALLHNRRTNLHQFREWRKDHRHIPSCLVLKRSYKSLFFQLMSALRPNQSQHMDVRKSNNSPFKAKQQW